MRKRGDEKMRNGEREQEPQDERVPDSSDSEEGSPLLISQFHCTSQ